MAFANTATNVQVLQDTADRAEIKLLRYAKTASDETDVQKVDAESLAFRTFILTSGANTVYGPGGFPRVPSVSVHDANTNNVISASVIDIQGSGDGLANSNLVVTAVTGNGALSAGVQLICDRVGVGALFDIAAVVTPVRQLDIESIWFTISGEASKVGIEFGGYAAPVQTGSTYSSSNVGVFTRDGANSTIDTGIVNGAKVLLGDGTKLTVNVANTIQFTTSANTPNIANTTVQVFGYTTAKLLGEGSGYYGRNALQAELTPPASANSDGSIYVSTYGMPNESMYDIVLELRKSLGYAEPTIY